MMNLGQVLVSLGSWRKLSAVNMKPKVAYDILKYTALVTAESEVIEKQRITLIYDVTGAEQGESVQLVDGTPEHATFVEGFNEILSQESDLAPIQMSMDVVIDALEGKDDALSVSDLAALEPFFAS
jgi:hypothetical protein